MQSGLFLMTLSWKKKNLNSKKNTLSFSFVAHIVLLSAAFEKNRTLIEQSRLVRIESYVPLVSFGFKETRSGSRLICLQTLSSVFLWSKGNETNVD